MRHFRTHSTYGFIADRFQSPSNSADYAFEIDKEIHKCDPGFEFLINPKPQTQSHFVELFYKLP